MDLASGAPFNWPLYEAIAAIPNDHWWEEPEGVSEEIKRAQARYLADTLKEGVEFAPSGRLTLVPQPFKESEHLGELVEMVRVTLELATANLSNGLSPTCYQAQLIERALTRYGNDPHRIEMTFEQAKASLMQDMAEEAIPSSPANRDLVQTLGDAAGSIRDSDPEIAEKRERLNRIRLGQLSHEDAAKVAKVAVAVADISEGVLKEDLLEDRFRLPGATRDDGLLDPVVPIGGAERNATLEAQLRVYSRLAKVWLFLKPKSREQFVAEVSMLTGIIAFIVAVAL
ncbi:MAG: hypothetical protein ACU0GG_21435 [Paracoccaceae bacterium]